MKYTCEVTHTVEVELDESKFTPEFLKEFAQGFYDFDNVEEHAKFIAELKAQHSLYDFTEGYGNIDDFGIKASVLDVETYAYEF